MRVINIVEKIVLNIYPILLLVMTFFGAKRAKKGEVAGDFLSLSQSKLIQGFACVAIIIHHLTQQITEYGYVDKGFITIFNYIGILFTALFFFFSGYGLIASVYTKDNYMKSFPVKRFPTVLIPFWIINILGFLLVTLAYGAKYTLVEALSDIFGYTLINSNGWFIVEIVFIYIFFYVLFSLIKNKDVAMVLLTIAVILLIVYSYFQGHDQGTKSHWFKGEWWFNSTITFVFGMVYARFKDGLTEFINKHYKTVMMITIVLFLITLYESIINVMRFGYYMDIAVGIGKYGKLITLISQMAVCLVSTMLVLLLNMKITIGNKVLKYISGMSVELYLIHGFFVHNIFESMRMGDVTRFAVVLASSIACTAVISPTIRWIVKKVTGLSVSKKKPQMIP